MEIILFIAVIALVALLFSSGNRGRGGAIGGRGGFGGRSGLSLDDEKAEARRWIDRLGGQVLNLQGTDEASKQAMADASERFTAAGSQIEQAASAHQAQLAKQTALEGLYYVRAARTAMGLDPGPELPKDPEQERAGRVTEHRTVDHEGEHYELSPEASDRTPYYHPGGRVAGRYVPQGWYNQQWWAPALMTGVWAIGSMMMFNMMFMGMAGMMAADAWADGADVNGDTSETGDMGSDGGDAGADGADGGDYGGADGGDYGGDAGGDFGGGDFGGGFGGGFDGGGDFGGFDF